MQLNLAVVAKEMDSVESSTGEAQVVPEEEETFEWPVPEKVVSMPIGTVQSQEKLKEQKSAPSYLHSLTENDAPSFRKPGKEPRPAVLTGTIITEEDVVNMIATHEADPENGMRKYLLKLVVEKKITDNYNLTERNFLASLLMETVDYAAQRDFDAHKLAVLMTIYLATHLYFKWYYWSSPVAVWAYFKEVMVRHSIYDAPYGEWVFEPDESYDILTHFHTAYMNNLPLIHILTFCASRLKFVWPFKPTK